MMEKDAGQVTQLNSSEMLSRHVEDGFVSKTSIAERQGLGRVVIAAQDFAVGDVILREDPVLVWTSGDWRQCMEQFRDLPHDDQLGILDMFHPPLDEDPANDGTMFGFPAGMDAQKIRKLVAIANTNAHEYYGRAQVMYSEIVMPDGIDPRTDKAALFLYASKVAHSCRPNSSYSSKTADGRLEYKAIRSIGEGDMVTFSYLENLPQTPTFHRRQELMRTKSFLCKCERCMAPDCAHSFPCPGCEDLVPGSPAELEDGVPWFCQACNKTLDKDALLRLEAVHKERADQSERGMMLDITSFPPHRVKEDLTRMAADLGRLHFLSLRLLASYARLCASRAHSTEAYVAMLPPAMIAGMTRAVGSPRANREKAGVAGLELARACECIDVGCLRQVCHEIHPPSFEMTHTVFHAAQDLMKAAWTADAAKHVRSYLEYMRIMWGQDDEDVARIEQSLPASGVRADSVGADLTAVGVSTTATSVRQEGQPGKNTKKSGKKKSNKKKSNKKKGKNRK